MLYILVADPNGDLHKALFTEARFRLTREGWPASIAAWGDWFKAQEAGYPVRNYLRVVMWFLHRSDPIRFAPPPII